MRVDMFKVIVERPRWGSRFAPSPKLRKDKHPHKQIGLKRHASEQRGIHKSLNENLAPLVRFIGRRVGRRWDDVFSEICETLDTGSTVKIHVRQHLPDFVLFRIVRGQRGELLSKGRALLPNQHNCHWPEFYVDPADGILKDRVWFWRDQGEAAPTRYNDLSWSRRPWR